MGVAVSFAVYAYTHPDTPTSLDISDFSDQTSW